MDVETKQVYEMRLSRGEAELLMEALRAYGAEETDIGGKKHTASIVMANAISEILEIPDKGS